MKVRTFYANSMQEAIRAIKEELGTEAVILSTRRVRKWGNAFGMLGSTALEVMAAIEEDMLVPTEQDTGPSPQRGTSPDRQDVVAPSFESNLREALHEGSPRSVKSPDSVSQTPAPARHQSPGHTARSGLSKNDQGARRVESEPSPLELADSLQGLYAELTTQGLRADTAYHCLRELQDTLRDPDRTVPQFMLQLLRGVLGSRLRSAGPLLSAEDDQKLVLFVGPSGVGKTTTIAKLAAHYRLEEKRSVAMVTIDTYRPAAVEQLRLYANVLGVELTTAASCDEARECITHMGQAELVLVDTPGLNPRTPGVWDQWKALAELPHRLETHLVLTATTRIQDIEAAVGRCAGAPGLRLLFTKLDETTGYGSVFETAHSSGIPLSYWGTGPRVPEDLIPASPDRLIDFLLGGTVPMKETSAASDDDIGSGEDFRQYRHAGRRAAQPSISVTSVREQQHE